MSYAQQPDSHDPAQGGRRRSARARFWMAITLIVMDLALVAVAGSAWSSTADRTLPDNTGAAIDLLGAAAAFGTALASVLALTNLSILRSDPANTPTAGAHRLASAGKWLSLLLLVGLLTTTVSVAVTAGASALSQATDWCTVALAGFTAAASVILAWSTARHIDPNIHAR